ncbi:MAG: alpha-glucosidase C-terminal domain-containing protein [Proteobacteria bacterium]|nr:alpha-glucosidase C-terminal domain-containing protein [Pseudomonadota bacterium]
MTRDKWTEAQASRSLNRLLPKLESIAEGADAGEWQLYVNRLQQEFPRLFRILFHLYADNYDFFFYLEELLVSMTRMWLERSADLKALDAARLIQTNWFESNRMVGAMCYVDLFAGDLHGLRKRIPYLAELGINMVHLMPIFKCPEGDNDGGYAISDYRSVNDKIGTIEELQEIATELRRRGISLVLDFIFNHTSDEHEWAKRALAGEEEFQNFYRMFEDRREPDEYEKSILAIFPDDHPGCFTYRSKIRRWVWTTFNNFQWDLNYENPQVFNSMAAEMLFLANIGVEILRLDAVAFVWKKKGTSCQNLPEAHMIIQAFNSITNIVAPAMVFKSEAIVHPDEVARYIHPQECQISYNPLLMALLWEALATKNTGLLRHSLERRFAIPDGCAWVNYIRCHDDIGWTFSDEDAAELHISPHDHRRFLNDFYSNRFKDSFARGLTFQEDALTGDARICGSTASLCGLEKALADKDDEQIELAISRILLLHGVIATIGGIPMIYLGDALGFVNDYSFREDSAKAGDNRWLHRPAFDWKKAEDRFEPDTPIGKIFHGILRLIQLRQQHKVFGGMDTEIIDPKNNALLGYFRHFEDQSALCLANFSAETQTVPGSHLRLLGMRKTFTDLMSGKSLIAMESLVMEPYQFKVLVKI